MQDDNVTLYLFVRSGEAWKYTGRPCVMHGSRTMRELQSYLLALKMLSGRTYCLKNSSRSE